jgi:hypothetical protein
VDRQLCHILRQVNIKLNELAVAIESVPNIHAFVPIHVKSPATPAVMVLNDMGKSEAHEFTEIKLKIKPIY